MIDESITKIQTEVMPSELLTVAMQLPAIEDDEQATAVRSMAAMAIELRHAIDVHYAPLIEAQREALEIARAAKRSHTDALDQAEAIFRKLLGAYLTEAAETGPVAGGRAAYEVEIVDESLVPREFCKPDLSALKRAAKDSKGSAVIPGVKITASVTAVIKKA